MLLPLQPSQHSPQACVQLLLPLLLLLRHTCSCGPAHALVRDCSSSVYSSTVCVGPNKPEGSLGSFALGW
jgi:hypothetical protein